MPTGKSAVNHHVEHSDDRPSFVFLCVFFRNQKSVCYSVLQYSERKLFAPVGSNSFLNPGPARPVCALPLQTV